MRFRFEIDGHVVTVQRQSDGTRDSYVVDGLPLEADLCRLDGNTYSALVGLRSHEIAVHNTGGQLWVELDGRAVRARELRGTQSESGAAEATDGRAEIRAPMPGKVIRVLAQAGEEVAAGQPILVIEAMKMQNEVRAPRSGKLTRLGVGEGDAVGGGALLFALE